MLTIGYTHTDRYTVLPCGYIPACDGYRPGATQDTINLDIDWAIKIGDTVEHWAEAVFIATNAPQEVIDSYGRAAVVAEALATTPGADWRALSVGDTVTLNGETLACDRVGWVKIDLAEVTV